MDTEKKIYIVAVHNSTAYAYQQLRDDAKFIENVFQVAAQNLYRRGIEYCCNAALLELHVPVNMPEKVWLSDLNRMTRWGVVVVDKCYNGEDIYELLYHNIDENLSLCLSNCETENFMIPYPEVEFTPLEISMLTCLSLQIRHFPNQMML
jgi:hypothetical protein